ncbi:MAG: HesA/MoeB/ThiF family protein [Elusimicrobiales bacterium]|nr:HesA/MoeB/ThiF family protein [Elusimicrobiales bacterium]
MTADISTPENAPSAARYSRHAKLALIGPAGQAKIEKSSILLIGCGSLGCAQAAFLARAGVGRLTLADRDTVQAPNMATQLLYDERDLRDQAPKAEAAARHLRAINSGIAIEPVVADITAANIEPLVNKADLVLDATDNFETRFLLNDAAVKAGKPWIYGGVLGTDGMVMAVSPGQGPCLRCLFDLPAPEDRLPPPDVFGVLATAAAWVAALQTTQALKALAGGKADWGRMHTLDIWNGSVTTAEVPRDPACPCCGRREFRFLKP